MTEFYFAADGSYGEATDMIIVDTTDWTNDDWELIEFSADMERSNVAQRLSGVDD